MIKGIGVVNKHAMEKSSRSIGNTLKLSFTAQGELEDVGLVQLLQKHSITLVAKNHQIVKIVCTYDSTTYESADPQTPIIIQPIDPIGYLDNWHKCFTDGNYKVTYQKYNFIYGQAIISYIGGMIIRNNINHYSSLEQVFVWHGTGKIIDLDGNIYDGQWENGQKHGKGRQVYENGNLYDGQWKNGHAHGKGRQTYSNGHIYDGQWKNGQKHGKGRQDYENGDRYDGQWENGQKHGKGRQTYKNGNFYDGYWNKDIKDGTCIEITKVDGLDTRYEGSYQKGFYHGNCTEVTTDHNGVTTTYTGKYQLGERYLGTITISSQQIKTTTTVVSATISSTTDKVCDLRSSHPTSDNNERIIILYCYERTTKNGRFLYENGKIVKYTNKYGDVITAVDGKPLEIDDRDYLIENSRKLQVQYGTRIDSDWIKSQSCFNQTKAGGWISTTFTPRVKDLNTYTGELKYIQNNRLIPHGYGIGIVSSDTSYEEKTIYKTSTDKTSTVEQNTAWIINNHGSIRYIGNWSNGLPNGIGTQIVNNPGGSIESIKYSGIWINGAKHGEAIETIISSDSQQQLQEVYIGSFCNNKRHDTGILEITNKTQDTIETYHVTYNHNELISRELWTDQDKQLDKLQQQLKSQIPHIDDLVYCNRLALKTQLTDSDQIKQIDNIDEQLIVGYQILLQLYNAIQTIDHNNQHDAASVHKRDVLLNRHFFQSCSALNFQLHNMLTLDKHTLHRSKYILEILSILYELLANASQVDMLLYQKLVNNLLPITFTLPIMQQIGYFYSFMQLNCNFHLDDQLKKNIQEGIQQYNEFANSYNNQATPPIPPLTIIVSNNDRELREFYQTDPVIQQISNLSLFQKTSAQQPTSSPAANHHFWQQHGKEITGLAANLFQLELNCNQTDSQQTTILLQLIDCMLSYTLPTSPTDTKTLSCIHTVLQLAYILLEYVVCSRLSDSPEDNEHLFMYRLLFQKILHSLTWYYYRLETNLGEELPPYLQQLLHLDEEYNHKHTLFLIVENWQCIMRINFLIHIATSTVYNYQQCLNAYHLMFYLNKYNSQISSSIKRTYQQTLALSTIKTRASLIHFLALTADEQEKFVITCTHIQPSIDEAIRMMQALLLDIARCGSRNDMYIGRFLGLVCTLFVKHKNGSNIKEEYRDNALMDYLREFHFIFPHNTFYVLMELALADSFTPIALLMHPYIHLQSHLEPIFKQGTDNIQQLIGMYFRENSLLMSSIKGFTAILNDSQSLQVLSLQMEKATLAVITMSEADVKEIDVRFTKFKAKITKYIKNIDSEHLDELSCIGLESMFWRELTVNRSGNSKMLSNEDLYYLMYIVMSLLEDTFNGQKPVVRLQLLRIAIESVQTVLFEAITYDQTLKPQISMIAIHRILWNIFTFSQKIIAHYEASRQELKTEAMALILTPLQTLNPETLTYTLEAIKLAFAVRRYKVAGTNTDVTTITVEHIKEIVAVILKQQFGALQDGMTAVKQQFHVQHLAKLEQYTIATQGLLECLIEYLNSYLIAPTSTETTLLLKTLELQFQEHDIYRGEAVYFMQAAQSDIPIITYLVIAALLLPDINYSTPDAIKDGRENYVSLYLESEHNIASRSSVETVQYSVYLRLIALTNFLNQLHPEIKLLLQLKISVYLLQLLIMGKIPTTLHAVYCNFIYETSTAILNTPYNSQLDASYAALMQQLSIIQASNFMIGMCVYYALYSRHKSQAILNISIFRTKIDHRHKFGRQIIASYFTDEEQDQAAKLLQQFIKVLKFKPSLLALASIVTIGDIEEHMLDPYFLRHNQGLYQEWINQVKHSIAVAQTEKAIQDSKAAVIVRAWQESGIKDLNLQNKAADSLQDKAVDRLASANLSNAEAIVSNKQIADVLLECFSTSHLEYQCLRDQTLTQLSAEMVKAHIEATKLIDWDFHKNIDNKDVSLRSRVSLMHEQEIIALNRSCIELLVKLPIAALFGRLLRCIENAVNDEKINIMHIVHAIAFDCIKNHHSDKSTSHWQYWRMGVMVPEIYLCTASHMSDVAQDKLQELKILYNQDYLSCGKELLVIHNAITQRSMISGFINMLFAVWYDIIKIDKPTEDDRQLSLIVINELSSQANLPEANIDTVIKFTINRAKQYAKENPEKTNVYQYIASLFINIRDEMFLLPTMIKKLDDVRQKILKEEADKRILLEVRVLDFKAKIKKDEEIKKLEATIEQLNQSNSTHTNPTAPNPIQTITPAVANIMPVEVITPQNDTKTVKSTQYYSPKQVRVSPAELKAIADKEH